MVHNRPRVRTEAMRNPWRWRRNGRCKVSTMADARNIAGRYNGVDAAIWPKGMSISTSRYSNNTNIGITAIVKVSMNETIQTYLVNFIILPTLFAIDFCLLCMGTMIDLMKYVVFWCGI